MTYEEFTRRFIEPTAIELEDAKEGLYYAKTTLDSLTPDSQSHVFALLAAAKETISERFPDTEWIKRPEWAIASLAAIAVGVHMDTVEGKVDPADEIMRQDHPSILGVDIIKVSLSDLIGGLIDGLNLEQKYNRNWSKRETPNMN